MNDISFLIIVLALGLVIIFAVAVFGFLRLRAVGEQAGVIQVEVGRLANDVGCLDERVQKLQRHFELASDDVRQIRILAEKVTRQATRIEEVEMGENDFESASQKLAKPAQTITSG